MRQPARKHGITNPAILAPIACEVAVLEAVEAKHGRAALRLVSRDLRRPRCHAHVEETVLALRTLAERDTDTPLRLFRHLLNEALGGDQLVDKREQIRRTVAAELEGFVGCTVAELEDRLAAVRLGGDVERERDLEAAIRKLAGITPPDTRPKPPPAPRPTPSVAPAQRETLPQRATRGASYVESLPAHLRALFQAGNTS